MTHKKYFNQCLLIFRKHFNQSVLQQKNLIDQIKKAMKKVTRQLTAGMIANYEEIVKRFVSNERGFLFINQIKRSPGNWKKFQGEVSATVKQLGCPTFFYIILC